MYQQNQPPDQGQGPVHGQIPHHEQSGPAYITNKCLFKVSRMEFMVQDTLAIHFKEMSKASSQDLNQANQLSK
eukprot:12923962-Prorocentrum_lima.AAC.1